jgi:hypothetical protein
VTERSGRLARWASLLALMAALGAWAVHLGFSHVSDDDYARVVIAEQFAHAPRWDPSGTSWLPFPFWVYGTAMLLLGRSVWVASGVAWILGLLSVLVGYGAMRIAGVARTPAWFAAALVATSPWNLWLGVATIPEAPTATLIFLGAMTLVTRRARVLGGAALGIASLSRYEAWPVCAVFATVCLVDALSFDHYAAPRLHHAPETSRPSRTRRPASMPESEQAKTWLALGLSLLGPCVWMAWNAHAHGSALHFVARVTAFHKSHATTVPLIDRLLGYPRALVTSAPELAALGLFGVFGGREVFARWRVPLLTGAALLGFLVYGEMRDGAPTHHAERALAALWWILAGFGADGVSRLLVRHARARPKREAWAVAFGVAGTIALLGDRMARLRDFPGSGEEDRATQVARGLSLREDSPPSVTVVPCEYEHFALIAAFGAPERVQVLPPRHVHVTTACPALLQP